MVTMMMPGQANISWMSWPESHSPTTDSAPYSSR